MKFELFPTVWLLLATLLSAVQCNPPVPLGGRCIIDSQCGANAICNDNEVCSCPLGFKAKDTTNCQLFPCTKDAGCLIFSNHTVCITGECFCAVGWEVDNNEVKCVPASQYIGGACTKDTDCGIDAVCAANKCTCKFGEIAQSNGLDCSRLQCTNDPDCVKMVDENSHFANAACVCNEGRHVDRKLQVCAINDGPTPLGGKCMIDSQCGSNAICNDNEVCSCPLGFQPKTDKINCQLFPCSSDTSCLIFSKHTVCITGECFCADGYEVNNNEVKCVATSQYIGGACTKDTDCGMDAVCAANKCTCKFGEAVQDNGQDCAVMQCTNDADCTKSVDKNSHCASSACVCNKGRHVDTKLQACSNALYIGGACTNDADCGIDAVCAATKCTCKFGETVQDNGQDCSMVQCNKDADCFQKVDKNSHCVLPACVCNKGRHVDTKLQVCSSSQTQTISTCVFIFGLLFVKIFN